MEFKFTMTFFKLSMREQDKKNHAQITKLINPFFYKTPFIRKKVKLTGPIVNVFNTLFINLNIILHIVNQVG